MPTTIAPVDQMTDAEYMQLKAKCEREGTSVSLVRKAMFEDSVVCDIFPEVDEKLEKIRDGIAVQQSRLDQLEAAARSKADAFIGAVNRRDTIAGTIRLLNERKSRISDHLENQPNYIEALGADKARSDADFVDSCDYLQKYKVALSQLESLLEQHQGNLVLAEAAVASFAAK